MRCRKSNGQFTKCRKGARVASLRGLGSDIHASDPVVGVRGAVKRGQYRYATHIHASGKESWTSPATTKARAETLARKAWRRSQERR